MTNDEGNEKLASGPEGRGVPGMSQGARRGFVYLAVLTLLLAGLNLLWTARQVGAANTKTQAQCQFDADIGGAPFPPSAKPSLLGVTIVSDARVAWHHLGCTGHLPPPTPSFRHWAAHYHLPVS